MELASHGKATHTPVDAAVTRRCIAFILRSTVGSLLGEKAQTNAAKQLSLAVATQKLAIGELTGKLGETLILFEISKLKYECVIASYPCTSYPQ